MSNRILIAGSSFGFGHTQAARNVAQALGEIQAEWEVDKLDVFDFLPGPLSWLTMKSWEFASTHIGWAYRNFYSHSVRNPVASLVVGKLAETATTQIVRKLNCPPDVFVATHSFAVPIGSLLKKRFGCRLCVVATDFILHDMQISPDVDFLFLPPDYECKARPESISQCGGEFLDTGIPISTDFARPKDVHELQSRLRLSPHLATVLVTFGGSGLRADAHIEMFSHLLDLPIQLLVLSGHNNKFARTMRKRYCSSRDRERIKVFDFIDNVTDFYSVADVFIGKAGGLSTSEALAVGLPIVIVDLLPGQEESNARVLSNAGLAAVIPSVERLRQHLESMPIKMGNKTRTLHDFARPFSSQTVAERIAGLAG